MTDRITPKPVEFHPELTDDRLALVAKALLDVYDETHAALSTELDDNYTRGTTTFGRSRNKLIAMHRSGLFSAWFNLLHAGTDITCAIGQVPFRFFRDDHVTPEKRGFWRRNPQDDMFAEDDDQPTIFRFVLEHPLVEDDEARVYFLGFSQTGTLRCEWQYAGSVRLLHSVDDARAHVEAQDSPTVLLRDSEEDSKPGTADGGHDDKTGTGGHSG